MPNNGKVIVIGDSWPSLLMASCLKLAGIKTELFQAALPLTPPMDLEPVFLGNGDTKDRVLATMGEELGEKLFRISERNYERALSLFQEYELSIHSAGLHREEVSPEKGFVFSKEELVQALTQELPGMVQRVEKVIQVDANPTKQYEVTVSYEGKVLRKLADLVVVISEYWVPTLLPSFHEKLIPVTLHAYRYSKAPQESYSIGFFHGGADYVLFGGKQALYGSYRNLFEDKGVGILKEADPKTKAGIASFFGGKGWLKGEGELQYAIESVSCDGLPIVGATSEMPGVYIAAGFAGKKANFLFEICEYLTKGIVKGNWAGEVEAFTTKRFIS